jgi:hypothetical protein
MLTVVNRQYQLNGCWIKPGSWQPKIMVAPDITVINEPALLWNGGT